jgi:DNA-binding transcriptional LysR family regulator
MPLIQIALHDYGVIYVPASAVQSHLESGHLVSVLDEFTRRDIRLSAAYAQHRHNSAAQRALLDFLQSRLGSQANVADRSNKGALASHAICPQI